MYEFFTFWPIFLLGFRLGIAAPSIEACPPDSVLSGDVCICDLDSCTKPPCLSDLGIVSDGNNEPGSCCPIYSCEGCRNDTLIEGKCPCAPGAVLNEKGICECIDKERHLVEGECVCNPQQCELPRICDRKSVLTTIEDGCCRKTRCVPCPQDSESTNVDTDELEDHCVCLPCVNDCGFNKTVVIKKKGTGFPGNCCDLYECKPLAEEKDIDCVVGDIIYENGEEWSTDDKQKCQCKNGISLCTSKSDETSLQNCYDEAIMYRHNETWLKDNGCTNCTCLNGELKCISHYCDVKESQIKENGSASCSVEKKVFAHLQSWTEDDGCTKCICVNGEAKCDSKSCEETEESKIGECQPLVNCNKKCVNGFRLNKKGCEICKCNPSKVNPELLTKYNITYSELLNILEDYRNSRTSSSTSSPIINNFVNISDTLPHEIKEYHPSVPSVVLIRRNENDEKTTSPETMITPAYFPEDGKSCWIIVAALVGLIVGLVAFIAAYFIYRNKRKYSFTSSRGSYHSVMNTTTDNNNTIKKNSIRFDNE